MRYRLAGLVALCLAAAIFMSTRLRASEFPLRVNESSTEIKFEDSRTTARLAIENTASRAIDAEIELELLDPKNVVVAYARSRQTIQPGAGGAAFAFAQTWRRGDSWRDVIWLRLHYRLTIEDAERKKIEGIISLSEITPDVFSLRVVAPEHAAAGNRLQAQVRAIHPVSSRPVANVRVEAALELDDENATPKLKAFGLSNAEGYVAVEFKLPAKLAGDEMRLKIVAAKGDFKQEAEEEIRIGSQATVSVTTDKPLYQPGQTLHIRALIFDANRRAMNDAKAELTIEDPEGGNVFRADLKTSRFGVASVDWPIPESVKLGAYSIEVELDDGASSSGRQTFKISRYELPNFTVNVKRDRAYYLPEQNAEIEIRADYLFGRPVAKGHVRVVREKERRWDFRRQKWETDEGDKHEGEFDARGRFVAKVDLSDEHESLAGYDYERYRDLSYAAYVTDATTAKTEQRRFDLRVSKDPIHVYVIGNRDEQRKEFPLEFYVSTFYADGAPAECEVEVRRAIDERNRREAGAARSDLLRSVRTNRYGVAKIGGLALAASDPDDSQALIHLVARDARGAAGHHTEDFYLRDGLAIRVTTGKTIHRAGEPINVEIAASKQNANLIVDLSLAGRSIESRFVQLRDGKAQINFPYRAEFKNEVTVTAYDPFSGDGYAYSRHSRTVIYPRNRDLKLDVKLDAVEYRPGADVRADFAVRAASGALAESALGVVVYDKAVDERARTDGEFGGSPRSIGIYWAERSNPIAGFTRKDLEQLDLGKPVPEEMEIIAEVLLCEYGYQPRIFGGDEFERDCGEVFDDLIDAQLQLARIALDSAYQKQGVYPRNEIEMRRVLSRVGVSFDEVRDPWGNAFRAAFVTDGAYDAMVLTSAGADKRFGTADDFTAFYQRREYFRFHGDAIDRAVHRHYSRTGDFIRDAESLKRALLDEGFDAGALRDPWGQPYRFEFGVDRSVFTTTVRSGGPNGRFENGGEGPRDDVVVWSNGIDYFAETRTKIETALADYFKTRARFPQDAEELREALKRGGVEWESLRDAWNREYLVTFKTEARGAERATIRDYARYGEKPQPRIDKEPVTQQFGFITLRCAGTDGKANTTDDFEIATFSRIFAEAASEKPVEKLPAGTVVHAGARGAIRGVVTDANGAAIAEAKVKATFARTSLTFEGKTNSEGLYLLPNLPGGMYEVRFDSRGFRSLVYQDVRVFSSLVIQVNAVLEVGTVSEVVTVSSGVAEVQTTSDYSAATVVKSAGESPGVKTIEQNSTQRLREYFPETLLWQPELVTDRRGRASLKFKLADSITTWKMAVIGSTLDGEVGMIEREFRAFQPFFLEHDPPRVLTEGDEISLPVVLRNFSDQKRRVDVEMKPESWFTLLGPARRPSEIAAGDAAQAIFDFRAAAAVSEGKQRIAAIGAGASDAVEKSVAVHPDGEEIALTAGRIFGQHASIDLSVPDQAIAGLVRSELKIYPNLRAHVVESVEGILQRPYGCGEQTISSTYPSLMLLRLHKLAGGEESMPGMAKARRFLQMGYERLLGYRAEGGGFTYWGRGEADPSLTAYALRFLSDAREFIEVDEDAVKGARDCLVKQQRADGSWSGDPMKTAQIARGLATGDVKDANAAQSAKRAIEYLAKTLEGANAPYAIAAYALAAFKTGEKEKAAKAVERLRAIVREEGGTNRWAPESNTPFHGWGRTGEIETTALAVQALCRAGAKNDEMIQRGLLFLLENKDRYGVWHSTQATINALDALIAAETMSGKQPIGGEPAEILVNGGRAATVAMPPSNKLGSPVTIDLSKLIATGGNRIEVRRSSNAALASLQIVTTFYQPWPASSAINRSSALRLAVSFDKTELKIGDEVTCQVKAGRINSYGAGMMLAEIGLPPGADVDRASLESAMRASGVDRYDVLPDRVVFYLWPSSGGANLAFKFRPRYGIRAQSAPSLLYDYYNPEARAVIAPSRFSVR